MKNQKFDTAIIYSDVVAETAVKGIKADKFIMFYHHGAMRKVYHDKYGYKKSNKIIAVSHSQAEALRDFRHQYKNKIIATTYTEIEELRASPITPLFEAISIAP